MIFTINEHMTMWSISFFFISVYIMYDKSQYFKIIGDFFLFISLGPNNSKRILYMSFPPLIISLLSIVCDIFF